jgi:low affinity Fe/Cu permease
VLAAFTIVVWLVTAALFEFSNTGSWRLSPAWQLAINSSTTIVTFLTVFPLCRTPRTATVPPCTSSWTS